MTAELVIVGSTAEEILAGDDYFRCEKQAARMKKSFCAANQKRVQSVTFGYETEENYPCRNCEQGRQIAAEFKKDSKAPSRAKEGKPVDVKNSPADRSARPAARSTNSPKPNGHHLWLYLYFGQYPETLRDLRALAAESDPPMMPQDLALEMVKAVVDKIMDG